MASAPLAVARVVNYCNPVYTRLAIAGPGQYMVRIARNGGLNTEICGIFIDKADAPRTQSDSQAMPCMWGVNYRPPEIPDSAMSNSKIAVAMTTWRAARHAFGPLGFAARWPVRLMALRAAAAQNAPAALLARWRWKLDIWTRKDRKVFDSNMNNAFRAMLKQWKGLKELMAKDHDLQLNSGKLGQGEL